MSRNNYSVYVIGHVDERCYVAPPIKVGRAINPEARARTLQTGNPNLLEICYDCAGLTRDEAIDLERYFHEYFAEHRTRGEWFDMSAETAKQWLKAFEEIDAAPDVRSADRHLTVVK